MTSRHKESQENLASLLESSYLSRLLSEQNKQSIVCLGVMLNYTVVKWLAQLPA